MTEIEIKTIIKKDNKEIKDNKLSKISSFNIRANRKIHDDLIAEREEDKAYIKALQELLEANGFEIPLPPRHHEREAKLQEIHEYKMKDGSFESLDRTISRCEKYMKPTLVDVQFRDLSFWGMISNVRIPTVGSTFRDLLLFGTGPKQRIDILKNLTGRIATGKMTLVMGPPGCGKSSFLKALAGQLHIGSNKLDGTITYNGDTTNSGKFRLPKIADYIDEKDRHAPTLTVWETIEFAWLVSSNGHHSYGIAANEESAKELDKLDDIRSNVHNVLQVLGLMGCANTVVGDGMIRGVSGGQKKRVTVGEMLIPPKGLKFMDAVSNGLDASTTFDIFRAFKYVSERIRSTICVSLLQPSPEVFNLFDEVILFSEGQIIYHGPTNQVLPYFESLGYICPPTVDLADYLQELPTPEGCRFIAEGDTKAPRGTNALSEVFKKSKIYQDMLLEMNKSDETNKNFIWPKFAVESFATSTWKCIIYSLDRQIKLTLRDQIFLMSRLGQGVLIGAITGSLFNNTPNNDVQTLSGMLFFSVLFSVMTSTALLPIIFEQREVFYKHSRAMFYPTSAFVIAQTLVLIPVQIIETIVFASIVYWSVGMSDADNGERFFVFLLILFAFNLCSTQYIRTIASFMPAPVTAQSLSGVGLVLMVLFSGYILPKSSIPDGWTWFYWLNPLAWALKSVTINEYLSSDYDWLICMDDPCTVQKRFGDVYLESRGNPTDSSWIWYGFAVLIGEFIFFIIATSLALVYLRVEPTPPPPPIVDEEKDTINSEENLIEIPFEPITFTFKDIWYTVTLKGGEELDLLRGVTGYFEPGTLTALMGSSGAGKTTLLDVLAGRKNTGVIKGSMYVNGKLKDDASFKKLIGYVEQFDTLSPHDTAREAVEFSAALRLPRNTPIETRQEWVKSVLSMLELTPLENTMVGDQLSGGMSFEQKKRLSIAVELAANPAILFLDEPTTGLDSRAAQVVIRCIRRVAASGRSIVCTIHQPSTYIFNSFDSLLLLKRGGQTVYNGPLGDNNCEHLVRYFESAPGVTPIRNHQNPATWMLEVIGAGTSGSKESITDFQVFYKQSNLCETVENKVNILNLSGSDPNNQQQESSVAPYLSISCILDISKSNKCKYNASYSTQFYWLMKRSILSYWRSPSYNFVRMMISIVIALIFSSAYADQNYNSDVDVISSCAVIYITCLFIGMIGLMTVQPVIFSDRPAFYREQFSEIYDVSLYTFATGVVELPYLLFSSIFFVIPFFFIVGFDKDGVAEKFFFYWLFQGLYMCTLVFIGHFYSALMPSEASSQVISGMTSTFLTLFCGFMIPAQNIPDFWLFIYWMNPLHYALEGLFTTQFHDDHTLIKLFNGGETTIAEYVDYLYPRWNYNHRVKDIIALFIFIIFLRIGTFLSLKYFRHDKR